MLPFAGGTIKLPFAKPQTAWDLRPPPGPAKGSAPFVRAFSYMEEMTGLGSLRRPRRAGFAVGRRQFDAVAQIAVPMSTLTPELQALDELTGGAFSAATSGERAARVRAWLEQGPDAELMQQVYRELSVKDRGAAKPLREKLDELKRQHDQNKRAGEWAVKAEALLAAPRLNVADALAWQRDAAKAGAPLSREPLATLKTQLAARAQAIDDLQHRVQVQREAAALLVQRIELLSTKSWQEADAVNAALSADV